MSSTVNSYLPGTDLKPGNMLPTIQGEQTIPARVMAAMMIVSRVKQVLASSRASSGPRWLRVAEKVGTKAEVLLKQLGLWEKCDQMIETFSRGMKQKMALSAAFLHEPLLVLLDEPLTGLDAAAARLVKDMLVDFVGRGGTVILTTHILEVAERLADRIGIIHRGLLHAEGSLEQLRELSGKAGATLEDVFLHYTSTEPERLGAV